MTNAWIIKPIDLGTVTASNTATGYAVTNVENDHLGVVWKADSGSSSRTLSLDLGADTAVDTALLLGCTGADADYDWRVKAATAAQGDTFPGGSYSTGVIDMLAGANFPPSGRGIALWDDDLANVPALSRYLEILIDPPGTAEVTVGRLVLGQRIVLDRNFSFGRAHGVRDLGGSDFSKRGVWLPKTGAKLRSIGLTYSSIHKNEAEDTVLPLIEEVGGSTPITIITDAAADDNRQRRIFHGPLVGDIGVVERRADRWEWRANLVSLV